MTTDTLYSTSNVLKECGISCRQLYYWELIGLIQPRYESFGMRRFRRYTRADLDLLREAKALMDGGFTLQAVREKLTEGRKTSEIA